MGLVNYNLGNLQAAINYYKQIFSNNPKPEEANMALAALEEIYVDDLGRPDEYFAFLETIPGYQVGNSERDSINFISAESQYENANYTRAITAYSDYIAPWYILIAIMGQLYIAVMIARLVGIHIAQSMERDSS